MVTWRWAVPEARPVAHRSQERRAPAGPCRWLVAAVIEQIEVGVHSIGCAGDADLETLEGASSTSASCVTSSPTIVMSVPLSNTMAAASGSAPDVELGRGCDVARGRSRRPSARSSPAAPPGCSVSSHAMFVRDPVGNEHDAGTETLRRGTTRRRRRPAAQSARAATARRAHFHDVHVIGDAELPYERAIGTTGNGHIGSPGEPEHLERVQRRLSSVWLPWTVVMPRSSTSGLASASKMGDCVVVPGVAVDDDRRWHARSIVQ